MNASQVIFYLLSAFILGAGLLAVTTRRIFRAAIWLLASLVGIAGLYFYLQVEFIAAVQIIVYVGGIVVLVIFSIFLTHQSGQQLQKPSLNRIVFSLLAALFGFLFSYKIIAEHGFKPSSTQPFKVEVSAIGEQMLDTKKYGFVLPFEVVSMLLLAAMVGCIVIAMRSTPKQKTVKPAPKTAMIMEEETV